MIDLIFIFLAKLSPTVTPVDSADKIERDTLAFLKV